MPFSPVPSGKLAIDFANTTPAGRYLSWPEFVHFLDATRTVAPERGAQLLSLPITEASAVDRVLFKALRLRESLRAIFAARVAEKKIPSEWTEPINEVLRVTEGHDELVRDLGEWRMEFIAREGGLDWLLAAIARSAAEIIVEGVRVPVRLCANPTCGLFFYDASRTRRRRWCSMARCGNRHKVAAFARRRKPRI